nr:FHA domain-containing protein [Microbacterium sp. ZXX196]
MLRFERLETVWDQARRVNRPAVEDPANLDEDTEATRIHATPPAVLHLTFSTQRAVTVPARVVIGREPRAVDGRHPITVHSPGRQLSRTHAAIDVDERSRIIVTDLNAPNGIEVLTTPPRVLTPGEPTMIPAGTKLLLGDVECIVTLASP